MKVRGFQGRFQSSLRVIEFSSVVPVAPAELEGHLLNHPDVADTCVVGIPDDYSGEVPMAFIVPSANALKRMKENPSSTPEIKGSIIKVCPFSPLHLLSRLMIVAVSSSSLQTTRFVTSTSRVGWSLWM